MEELGEVGADGLVGFAFGGRGGDFEAEDGAEVGEFLPADDLVFGGVGGGADADFLHGKKRLALWGGGG